MALEDPEERSSNTPPEALGLEILDLMPDMVVVSDADGIMRFVNRMAETLFGYTRAELEGKQLEVLIPARFRTSHRSHREAYVAAPRVRQMGVGLPLMALRKDGTEFPVEISLAPFDHDGANYTVAAVRDVTQRKRLEEQERELAKAQEEIRERDEVLTIASHELRAPVGSMQLQVGMLKRAAMEAADELNQLRDRMGGTAAELNGMRQRMGKVERHSRRLARLIDDLLESSHAGPMKLKLEGVDLADVVNEAVDGMREEVERTGSRLALSLPGNPVVGRWDPVRIEQVVANLILNAAKFGKGEPITVSVDGDHERGWFAVADRGIGIAPEDQERIFERFERAVADGGVLGLGLGLFIARQIVRAHGCTIRLESAAGRGSTFTVDLPLSPPS
jgi:two-component system, LuxR family, sensor kinase FixL